MEMNQSEDVNILYCSPNEHFLIDSIHGVRDYLKRENITKDIALDINRNDRIIRISANKYWYETDDLGRMIYYLLANKRLIGARQAEANKLYSWIRKAFQDTLL